MQIQRLKFLLGMYTFLKNRFLIKITKYHQRKIK